MRFGSRTRTLDDVGLVDFGLSCPLFPWELFFWLNGQGTGLEGWRCRNRHRKRGQAVHLIRTRRVEVVGVHAEIPAQFGYDEMKVEHQSIVAWSRPIKAIYFEFSRHFCLLALARLLEPLGFGGVYTTFVTSSGRRFRRKFVTVINSCAKFISL
jgi:hypothetical protein